MSRISNSVLIALFSCGLAACTTSESKDNTGGAAAGSTGAAGAAGGTTQPATGGAGAGGSSAAGQGTLCPTPNALVTDFTYPATATDPTTFHYGDSTTLGGGEYTYPAAIKSDFSQNNWHLSGSVADYSGFGLYFDNCNQVDASKYKGITFKISGTIPTGNSLTLSVGTVKNTIAASWLMDHGATTAKATDPGSCMPPADSSLNQYSQSTCHALEKTITVTATATPVNILWSDFTKGAPEKTVTPSEILNLAWYFSWGGSGPAYDVDVTIDDLGFIP